MYIHIYMRCGCRQDISESEQWPYCALPPLAPHPPSHALRRHCAIWPPHNPPSVLPCNIRVNPNLNFLPSQTQPLFSYGFISPPHTSLTGVSAWALPFRISFLTLTLPVTNGDDDMLTPTGYPPPPHSSRHGPQHTQHTASTAATPCYPQGGRQTPADASFF